MNLGIVDVVIFLLLLLGGVMGFKDGVLKKLTSVVGLILVVVLAFMLKGKLSVFFYENLPFFDFFGVFKGIQVLNIVFYESLAFLLIASALLIVYNVVLGITGILEKILKATVILSIPSKILGFIVGLLESYVWIYIILFVLTLPVINLKEVYESDAANFILKETPILSKYSAKTLEIYDNVYDIIDNKEGKTNGEINKESLELMLRHKMITVESAKKLVRKNKVYVEDDAFLDNYS